MAFDAADFIYESGVFRAQVVTNWPPNQRIIIPPPPPSPTTTTTTLIHHIHSHQIHMILALNNTGTTVTVTYSLLQGQIGRHSLGHGFDLLVTYSLGTLANFFYGIIWEFSQMANPPFWEPLKFGSFKNKILGDFFVCFLSFEFRLKILY